MLPPVDGQHMGKSLLPGRGFPTPVPQLHSPLANTPSPLPACLFPQKEGISKAARSKPLAPVAPEKNTEESSESSDEELPSSQVGPSSLWTPQTQGSRRRGWGESEGRPLPFKQHLTVSWLIGSSSR